MLSPKPFRHAPWLYAVALREAQVSDVVRVKVVLTEIVPPTWRRLRVPVHLTLRHFHAVIQEAIGCQRRSAASIPHPECPLWKAVRFHG